MTDFQYSLGNRYQMMMGTLSSYINQDTAEDYTVNEQQFYKLPVATVGFDSATVTIGSVKYTLQPIYSQTTWNYLNSLVVIPTSLPQFIFIRASDYGIWPTPTGAYLIEFNRFFRDRNLMIEDYSDGTISVTADDATVTGSGTTFTAAMVGRWFTVTDLTSPGQGYWYRVSSVTDSTRLELEQAWNSSSGSALTYRIGETPLVPEEGHVSLAMGATADFYLGLRNDTGNATWFDNMYWTGSGMNTSRDIDDKNVTGGLIGILRKYADRDRDNIIHRQPGIINPSYVLWGQVIT